MKKNNKKGFTLVELVIVIAVIAILAAVLIPTFGGIISKANKSAAEQEANNLYIAVMTESEAQFDKWCSENECEGTAAAEISLGEEETFATYIKNVKDEGVTVSYDEAKGGSITYTTTNGTEITITAAGVNK